MKKNSLISLYYKRKKSFIVTTDSKNTKSVAENLLNRNFSAKSINEKWVGDVTFIKTNEGWLHLAVVIDLFSRKVVGYALSAKNDAVLACKSFMMAVNRRQQPKNLIYHSDRGSTYGSNEFRNLLLKNNITPSMSRKGNCWDNAVAESFFDSYKLEVVYNKEFNLKIKAVSDTVEWIENFYNTKRMHSSIGYCSPAEFEEIHAVSK